MGEGVCSIVVWLFLGAAAVGDVGSVILPYLDCPESHGDGSGRRG